MSRNKRKLRRPTSLVLFLLIQSSSYPFHQVLSSPALSQQNSLVLPESREGALLPLLRGRRRRRALRIIHKAPPLKQPAVPLVLTTLSPPLLKQIDQIRLLLSVTSYLYPADVSLFFLSSPLLSIPDFPIVTICRDKEENRQGLRHL